MDLIGYGIIVCWLYVLCRRSDAIGAARAEYASYCRRWSTTAHEDPERVQRYFEEHLTAHEESLGQQIAAYEKYLLEHPSPPKAPPL
jgi:hypothetical protein